MGGRRNRRQPPKRGYESPGCRDAYWNEWHAAHREPDSQPEEQPAPKAQQRPRRVARMVPDDRRDEEIDFEAVMGAIAGAIIIGSRARPGGRGAA